MNQVTCKVEPIGNGIVVTRSGKTQYYKGLSELLETVADISNEGTDKDPNLGIIKSLYKDVKSDVPYTFSISLIPEDQEVSSEQDNKSVAIKSLLEDILERDREADNPVNLRELRLSVTIKSAYSPVKLKSIDFQELKDKHKLSMKDVAKIMGVNDSTANNLYAEMRKGKLAFKGDLTRVRLTTLAKYFEGMSGVRFSYIDKLNLAKANFAEQIEELQVHANKGETLIPGKKFISIVSGLRKALAQLPEPKLQK